MYQLPIDVYMQQMYDQQVKAVDDGIFQAVVNVGVSVDKEELIRALKYDREQYDKGFRDGVASVQRWISVEDRLPEEMEKVMAFVNGVRITAVLKGGVWLSSWNHDVVNDEVTHWMPLPEPPKEGDI